MRTGVVLPTFRDTPDAAFDAARAAIEAGVDGLFCYDHIWPIHHPERPALAPFPLLGALATMFEPGPGGGPFLGPLVARVGLVPNPVLAAELSALQALAPGRVIAALGTGDSLNAEENRAYGIPFAPAAERRAHMVTLARDLRSAGLPVWLAGGTAGRVDEARASGAALNLWDAVPALVAERCREGLEVTWAGPPSPSPGDLADVVRAVGEAGATWAVVGWPVDLDVLVDAGRSLTPG
jgi:hypothetical protein